MWLRPGILVEMSSHFMPLPLNWMRMISSSEDQVLCLFAGDSSGWGDILRFPPATLLAAASEGDSGTIFAAGTEEDRV